ncbi:MAG TPA: hypothetical protein VHD87_16865, partial [Acidimicrobiales bacterium]|nr:hypothetical protein [Acidimicrobiales bacterium]
PAPLLLSIALVSLPLVWAVQFTGGAGPQWGGRYVLLSSLLVMVVGVVSLADTPVAVARAIIGVSVLVTALGVAWMFQRTHDIAESARRLDAEPAPVLVSRVAHLVREGGAVHDLDRWLTAPTDADLHRVARVVDGAGVDHIALVDIDGRHEPAHIGRLRREQGSHSLRFLPGTRLRVWIYSRE